MGYGYTAKPGQLYLLDKGVKMNQEELLRIIQSLGRLSRIIRVEGIGGTTQEEGDLVKAVLEEDRLDLDGYRKIVITKHVAADCGHFSNIGGRCTEPSCRRTLCTACCKTCNICGRVYCGEHLSESLPQKNIHYCRACQWKAMGRLFGRKLLGFGE